MKKFRFLLVILAVAFSAVQLRADEGMWLLQMLEKMNIKTMRAEGCKLTAKQIYDINNSSLKDAIVHFGGGCTAEVVSDKGLVLTNHHCGYGSIQKISTVEHDYLRDGYWAMNSSEELHAPGLSVTFLEKFVDATDAMISANAKAIKGQKEKENYISKVMDSLCKAATGGDKYLDAYVVSFNAGNNYYVVVSKTFKDVRFVGAPPASIGKFGGETDNWEWPRHTGDFSVFRIYADKNNNPAKYSKDNVPYTPKNSLTISLKGYKPGDFSMIIGFPGRTNRYMTSAEVQEMQDITNAARIECRTIKENIWQKAMRASQKVNLQYASKFAGSSNFRKKSLGMNETFKKLGVIERRAEEERNFTEWVNASPDRVARYGKTIEKINSAVKERADAQYNYSYFVESINNIELLQPTVAAERDAKDFKEATVDFYKDYCPSLDAEVTKAMMKIYREKITDTAYIGKIYEIADKEFGGSIDKYVDYVFANSVFVSHDKAAKALADSTFKLSDDPAAKMLAPMQDVIMKLMTAYRRIANKPGFGEGKKEYIAGIQEMNAGKAMYPDANSTMRLSYGKVGGYAPKDGVEYKYYTTLDGVMQKEDPSNPEFIVPAKLKELWKNKDYGQYANANGELPVCFLTNNDITGGNSGSDVLNAKGELIGLAFDGNWESMSSDIIFEPQLQRCINVDIRYVLFVMDKFGGAGYLLNEMKFN